MSQKRAGSPPRRPRAGASLIAVAFVALAAWSWRRWPDILVDFGQQLYIPWQLAEGKRLHAEIAFLHGPLSQYLNALPFALFGPSFTILIFMNLAIMAALTWALHATVKQSAGRLTAASVGLAFLCLFGFSQYVGVGNYNFVAPYTHESTHGVALAIGMILALTRCLTRGSRAAWTLAGLCLGLAALTKVEVSLAAAFTAAIGVPLVWRWRRPVRSAAWLFAAAAAAPAIAFFLYFLTYLPAGRALGAVWGGFAALSGEVAANPFYMQVAGWDDPSGNLRRMLVMFLWIAAFFVISAIADVMARRLGRNVHATALGAGLLLFAALLIWPDLVPWIEIPRALPLTTLLATAFLSALLWRHRGDPERRAALAPTILLAVFALALLAKAALNLHLYHYGFYLAMPATLVVIVCGVWWVPKCLAEGRGCGTVLRGLALAVLAAAIVHHLRWSQQFYGLKTLPVGNGGDVIMTYGSEVRPKGKIVAEALRWIEERTPDDATLVGFPEGIMLNYLARRETSTPCMNFMMTEMILFGEEDLLDGFRSRPPDYVALVHKDTSEFGFRFFGSDPRYGRRTLEWVNEHYETAALFGAEPLVDERFGIKILRRRDIPGEMRGG